MSEYYEQPKTAYKKYLKFRAWENVETFETDKFSILYRDGTIGGNFQSVVSIHFGDLNSNTDLPASQDTWAVSAIRQHLNKPHRVVTVVVKSLNEARDLFDLLVKECKANVPKTGNRWRPINK